MHYELLRQFADSWGLIYMLAIFLAVGAFLMRPKAGEAARDAALVPLRDDLNEEKDK